MKNLDLGRLFLALFVAMAFGAIVSGCAQVQKASNAVETYLVVYCGKPVAERQANRVLLNTNLREHGIGVAITCPGDPE